MYRSPIFILIAFSPVGVEPFPVKNVTVFMLLDNSLNKSCALVVRIHPVGGVIATDCIAFFPLRPQFDFQCAVVGFPFSDKPITFLPRAEFALRSPSLENLV